MYPIPKEKRAIIIKKTKKPLPSLLMMDLVETIPMS
jgi:hypothetical protein